MFSANHASRTGASCGPPGTGVASFLRPAPWKLALLFALALAARLNLSRSNGDLDGALLLWYDHLLVHGAFTGLRDNFSNYAPAYTYLIGLMTLSRGWIEPVVSFKLIAIGADLLNAFFIWRIVRLAWPQGPAPWYAAALFLCLPSIALNSAVWGQADGVYMVGLTAAAYYMLRDQPVRMMLAFSLAFAVKLQAMFFGPAIAVLMLLGRVPLWTAVLVPLVYLLVALPTWLAGREWQDILLVYSRQGTTFPVLGNGVANLWQYVPSRHYALLIVPGLAIASIAMLEWLWRSWRRARALGSAMLVPRELLLLAVSSVMVMPFVLPKMHDRYFYAADVLSLVLAFIDRRFWWLAVAMQVVSTVSYLPFLFDVSRWQSVELIIPVMGFSLLAVLRIHWGLPLPWARGDAQAPARQDPPRHD